jgi:hypothetical protein
MITGAQRLAGEKAEISNSKFEVLLANPRAARWALRAGDHGRATLRVRVGDELSEGA